MVHKSNEEAWKADVGKVTLKSYADKALSNNFSLNKCWWYFFESFANEASNAGEKS